MVHTLAREVMAPDREIEAIAALIVGCFREHPDDAVTTNPRQYPPTRTIPRALWSSAGHALWSVAPSVVAAGPIEAAASVSPGPEQAKAIGMRPRPRVIAPRLVRITTVGTRKPASLPAGVSAGSGAGA